MGCCGINTKQVSYVDGVCAVCVENNQDDSIKKVFWCETCKAYICTKHKSFMSGRTKAAVKITGRKIINLLKK